MEADTLYSKNVMYAIEKIINRNDDELVICLNGGWGTGKTFLCKRLSQKLSAEYKCVYFDAFRSDYEESPLIPIISEIAACLSSEKRKEFLREAASFCGPLLGAASKAYLSYQTLGLSFISGLEQAAEKTAVNYAKNKFDDYLKRESSIEGLNRLISKVIRQEAESGKKGMVVIVDELDRCRPSYALEVIETIKHVFDNKGLSFILSMNKAQVLSSIVHAYGLLPEKESYIEKFIDITVQLKRDSIGFEEEGEDIIAAEADYSIGLATGRFNTASDNRDFVHYASFFIGMLVDRHSLSFREAERFIDLCVLTFLISDIEVRDEEAINAFGLVACGFSAFVDKKFLPDSGSGVFSNEAMKIHYHSGSLRVYKSKEHRLAFNEVRELVVSRKLEADIYFGCLYCVNKRITDSSADGKTDMPKAASAAVTRYGADKILKAVSKWGATIRVVV